METNQNPSTEGKKTSKTHYETLDEKITKMKVTFENASLPQISAIMATVGYTPDKITGMKTKLNRLVELNAAQVKESADVSAEQQKFKDKRAEINKVFNLDRGLARILFKNNAHACDILQLDKDNPVAYGNWNQLVDKFYKNILISEIASQANTIGITEAKVAAQQQALAELDGIKNTIIIESGEAHAATDARDNAFDELYPLYTTYLKYAKLIITDPNLLEMIGVRAK